MNCSYATVKKEPPARPPAPSRRRKRSTKSLGESNLQPESTRPAFKDSPFPERQKRGNLFGPPSRPPRRGSISSLGDQHKCVVFKQIKKKKTKFVQ